jgi:signal transduction histidine kinase
MNCSDGWREVLSSRSDHAAKISHDNLFRWWVSVFSLLAAFILWGGDTLRSIGPIVGIFLAYNFVQGLSWLLIKSGRASETLDLSLHAVDNAAITASLYWTGGVESPFCFLYAIPVIVEAYHKNLKGLIFNAAFGLLLYAGLLLAARSAIGAHQLVDVLARITFLALFSAVCGVSVGILKKKEFSLEKHLIEQKTAAYLREIMDGLTTWRDFGGLAQNISSALTQTVVRPFWHCRVWLRTEEDAQTLAAYGGNPGALRNIDSLSVKTCPALRDRAPFHLEDAAQGGACSVEQFSYGSHVCLPIVTKNKVFGVLFVGSPQEKAFSPEDVRFLDSLAKTTALGLERTLEVEELQFSYEVGSCALATFLSSTKGVDETISATLEAVVSILNVDRANVMLWEPKLQVLQMRWFRGASPPPPGTVALKMGEGIAGSALQFNRPYWTSDVKSDSNFVPGPGKIRSLLCIPMRSSNGQPLGVINALTQERTRNFSKSDVDFLSLFARQAALAIENALLHEEGLRKISHLQELDRMKSEFLSSVSHELRGPLTAIEGFAEVLAARINGPLSAKQAELLEQISQAARAQMRMVEDLLDLSSIERGAWSIRKAPCSLSRILTEEFEKARLFAEGQGVQITLELPREEMPPVEADMERIRQVVWNLLHNAIKYTHSGDRINLILGKEKDGVRVGVFDTGAGIPQDSLEKVFQKFHQAHGEMSQRVGGLGLGLALARQIVEAHGGRIHAQSQGLGHGSLFTFTLPFCGAGVPNNQTDQV